MIFGGSNVREGCSSKRQGNKREAEEFSTEQLLDEDFECKRRMALGMCQTLGRPKDRDICRSTLEQLANFNHVQSVQAKQNVHQFMNFYLKVLRWTQKHQPTAIYRQWYGDSFDGTQDHSACGAQANDGSLGDMRLWLEAEKSYLAMKSFDDGSTLIYAAVAKDPSAGWAHNGLDTLSQRTGGSRGNQNYN